MKTKKVICVLIVIVIGIVCFLAGWFTRDKDDIMCYDYARQMDSLKWMEVIRKNKQLPYYGMKKEEVLEMLPLPESNRMSILLDSDTLENLFWLYNSYKERLKGTRDTIIVDAYSWKIPYHDRPNLYIVFEKRDEEWIASTCVQWNPENLYID